MLEHDGQGSENAHCKSQEENNRQFVVAIDVMILLRDVDCQQHEQR